MHYLVTSDSANIDVAERVKGILKVLVTCRDLNYYAEFHILFFVAIHIAVLFFSQSVYVQVVCKNRLIEIGLEVEMVLS